MANSDRSALGYSMSASVAKTQWAPCHFEYGLPTGRRRPRESGGRGAFSHADRDESLDQDLGFVLSEDFLLGRGLGPSTGPTVLSTGAGSDRTARDSSTKRFQSNDLALARRASFSGVHRFVRDGQGRGGIPRQVRMGRCRGALRAFVLPERPSFSQNRAKRSGCPGVTATVPRG